MESPSRRWPHVVVVCVVVLFATSPVAAQAGELAGKLTDAATGIPIEGAEIRVLGTDKGTHTDAEGFYTFDLPSGTYELAIEARIGSEVLRSRHVNQRVPQRRLSRPRVYTDSFLKQGHEALEHPVGLPGFSGRALSDGPDSVDLSELLEAVTNPAALSIPSSVPTTIRVGRREDHTGGQGCTDSANPIVGIDEMPLDEYVKGVLPPEIGVFQSIAGASAVYKAFAIAAKSYALWFMLTYDSTNRRTLGRIIDGFSWFHIDDTACNQRYSDDRLAIATSAADAVQNKILVNATDLSNLEKYEYAASCGRHGTRPEHQDGIVADDPPQNACAGDWCGHDACAAHEDHPDVAGDDRCLVRGICQWGAASWGKSGKDYDWILEHYQPNLQVHELTPSGPATVVLTGYAHTDPNDIAGTGVADVHVELSDGQTTLTNADGRYRFDQVRLDLDTVEITATRSGYQTTTRSKRLEGGVSNWGSILLVASNGDSDVGPGADAQPPGDSGSPPDADPGTDTDALSADVGSSGDIDSSDSTQRPSDAGPPIQPSPSQQGGCATSVSSPLSLSLLFAFIAALVHLRRRST